MAKGGKKVLIIHGSPRKEGNTDILLREIVKGIKGENKEVELREIYLRELHILPCQECRVCNRSGRCIIKDDMQELSTELREADYIILGSPIFFYAVTTYVKAMVDRGQVFWVRKYLWKQSLNWQTKKERKGWFVSVGATRGKKLFEGAILTVKYFFDALDISYEGDLLVRGVEAKGDILNYPEVLSKAYELGKKIGFLLQKD